MNGKSTPKIGLGVVWVLIAVAAALAQDTMAPELGPEVQ